MESNPLKNNYYIICNPTSGNGIRQGKIDQIRHLLKSHQILHTFITTSYAHHEEVLIEQAIQKGYHKFICIGGDGTLHHMINGIMKQNYRPTNNITIGVIPTGTGNDWVKNYKIPNNIKKAIQLIKQNKRTHQDIGKLHLFNQNKEVYFNNAAGLGYDSFVVKNIPKYKKFGSLSYLFAGLYSFQSYRTNHLSYLIDSRKIESNIFMISLGIGKYSGGGMQLTDYKNHKENYFDLTIIKSIRFIKIISNIHKMYNGRINDISETYCCHAKAFETLNNKHYYIQADGELIGTGNIKIQLIPKAVEFIIG